MTQPAAFKATYSDWKLVKTRQVVQVIFEVPLADADAAYEILGGMPNYEAERWFGIAALDGGKIVATPAPEKERKDWRDLQPAQQAGIRCHEPTFWAFLREDHKLEVDDEPSAATAVRKICGVNSRASLSTNRAALAAWQELDTSFGAWKLAEQMA